MSEEPRPVELTLAGIRSLTALEVARGNTLAGVRQSDVRKLIGLVDHLDAAPPEAVEQCMTLLYAYAYELTKRAEPELTWAEAQRWRLIFRPEITDELAEASERASVQAAVLTGLPPAVAGELTQTQLDEYRAIAAERDKAMKSATRRRRSA